MEENNKQMKVIDVPYEYLKELEQKVEAYENNVYTFYHSYNGYTIVKTIKPDKALKEAEETNKQLKKNLEHYKNNKLSSLNIIEGLERQLNREKNKSLFDRIFKK